MDLNFWKSKRVFVTGHTGFKGAWLSLWLQNLGAEVCGYSLKPPTDPNLYTLADVSKNIKSIEGDIRELEKLSRSLKDFSPEIVIHMAAQSLVKESYANPIDTYSTNIMGTVNLLETLRHASSVRAAVIVTSDKCYENLETGQAYVETAALGGRDPYSSSKGCAEVVTSAMRRSFFESAPSVGIASVRAGNVIGGGDWAPDRLIPDFARAAEGSRIVKIRNPKATRPWQHVLDPLNGYLTLAEKLYRDGSKYAEAWNFGPNETESKETSTVANQICKLWTELRWEQDKAYHPHEARTLNLDCSKAREKLHWGAKLRFETAIEWTVDWYKSYVSKENMRLVTEKQITAFQKL